MKLVSVYSEPDAVKILYELLANRDPRENISHKEMPSWEDHIKFVRSKPYDKWYLIRANECWAGAIYVTKNMEVGIHIFAEHRGKGVGSWALQQIRARYLGQRLLANVAPMNEGSKAFFEKHGGKLIQRTYELT